MTADSIIVLVIYGLVALIAIVIGITQMKSRRPVGFYTGQEPPKEEELTDVGAWNRKHGIMWIAYGIVIILSGIAGVIMGDSWWYLAIMLGGTIMPLFFMIWYHHRLKKRYMVTV